jgi:hypothetical protein
MVPVPPEVLELEVGDARPAGERDVRTREQSGRDIVGELRFALPDCEHVRIGVRVVDGVLRRPFDHDEEVAVVGARERRGPLGDVAAGPERGR